MNESYAIMGGTKELGILCSKIPAQGFPGGLVVENLPASGDTGLSPGPGRSHMPRSN